MTSLYFNFSSLWFLRPIAEWYEEIKVLYDKVRYGNKGKTNLDEEIHGKTRQSTLFITR